MNKPENSVNERKEAAYPAYDLETCIKFAVSIKDLGGSKGRVKKCLLARQLGLAESTPSFFQRISSSKIFGIVEGWGTYSLTETGRMYFYPTSEQDRIQAGLMMLKAPDPFEKLISRFDGERLPTTELLGNILHQEAGIPDSWKNREAQLFVKSAQFLGIIDAVGVLRYDAALHKLQAPRVELPAERATEEAALSPATEEEELPQVAPPKTDNPRNGSTVWVFQYKGRQLKVETPEVMPKELWEKLNAYVQILKPSQDEKTSE